MVFGCSDDMLVLCPVLSQTPIGNLCVLGKRPKILEASDFRPEFRKKLVPYPPYPIHIRKAFILDISKRYNIPPLRNNIFLKNQPGPKSSC